MKIKHTETEERLKLFKQGVENNKKTISPFSTNEKKKCKPRQSDELEVRGNA